MGDSLEREVSEAGREREREEVEEKAQDKRGQLEILHNIEP